MPFEWSSMPPLPRQDAENDCAGDRRV
jgi:hypothetical protein